MGGRGRKKAEFSHWNYTRVTVYDNGDKVEYKTGGLGFSPSDFPAPIKEVNEWGISYWYGVIISYFYRDSAWLSQIPDPGVIYLRRKYRLYLGFTLPIAPYPQVSKIYNTNFERTYPVPYDKIIPINLPGDLP
jgi:hypothetical protein